MQAAMTIWYEPSFPEWYDAGIARDLAMIKAAGFSHVNWNPDAGTSYLYAEAEMHHVRELIDAAGLTPRSLHAAHGHHYVTEVPTSPYREGRKDFTSPVEYRRQAGVELLVNRLELGAILGIDNMVLHASIDDETFADPDQRAAWLATVVKSLDQVRPVVERTGVSIAVENLFNKAEHITALFDTLFERYPREVVGWCLDSGHGHVAGGGSLGFLAGYREHLVATHLHDNFGSTDDHLLPGFGSIDWDSAARIIAQSPLELPVVLETNPSRSDLTRPAFYAAAMKAAVMVTEKVVALRRG